MHNYSQDINTRQESATVDFKAFLDIASKGEFCEIIKDIVAMANSGGGLLLIGVNDDGTLSGFDATQVLKYDPANFTNKIYGYTGKHFDNFKIYQAERDGKPIAVIQVGKSSFPIVFTSPGNYLTSEGKQKNAFHVGVVYFRHGAKSEAGTSDDLIDFIKREVDTVKDYWLSGIRKVVEAPEGSQIMVLPANSAVSQSSEAHEFRITDSPDVPTLRVQEDDIFRNYPYDYRDLTEALKQRYQNFVANKAYHALRKPLESNPLFCNTRLLNPKKPNSTKVCFYSRSIFHEFDKHYIRRDDQLTILNNDSENG